LRVLELALAGALALSAAIPAYADPSGSKMRAAGPPPGAAQGGWGWHSVPGHVSQWKPGWVPPRWRPNGYPGGWGPSGGWWPYGGPGVPTYWVWGPSGGAFDYPFADWRGPSGGWGNP
jgi:hypothetical protein